MPDPKDLQNLTQQPDSPKGQERTADDPQTEKESKPAQLTDAEQKELISLVRRYKQSWFLRRRMIVKRVLKAYEFFKGNHFISFDPESFQWFDALEAAFAGQDGDAEDLNLYQFATNFYQMLGFAFVAALSAQLPKTRFLPENAEREEDIATAKAASRVQEIIERQNKIKSLQKQGLLFLWMAGCYFRHTRFVVDSDRAGTHQEPVIELKQQEVMPDRFQCPQCAGITPAAQAQGFHGAHCVNCGNKLSDNDFYPAETAEVPMVTEMKDTPNGMVAMTLYSPLMVDAAPYAKNLRETPILNVDEEVDLASLRASYPEQWEGLKGALGPMLSEAQNERFARMMVYSEEGARSSFVQDLMPTLSRTWIQPWAFNAIDDKTAALKIKGLFPKGCLLVNCGDLFLEAREAKLTDEWTWAGTVQETFGLYPPAVGDSAIPVQERINDVANIVHEYMDRISMGILLYNSNLIDGEALNGTALMPGRLTGLKMKQAATAAGNKLEDAIVHITANADAEIYSYQEKLVFTAQMLAGTPPQIYGGAGDPNIQTKGGQEQQLQTAMGKLSGFWDNICEEAAEAAEIAVECAQNNMNDDWQQSVTDESGEFKAEYVRLDEMQGNIHALPETDQGFPMSAAEMREFWTHLIEEAQANPFAEAIMDDPTNQEQAAQAIGAPGLVVPGRDMRNKCLRVVDTLLKQQPQMGADQMTGAQIPMPSIQPDKDMDDMDIIVKTVRAWAQKNFDKQNEQPEGFQNVILYYKMAVQYGTEAAAKQMQAQQPPSPKQLPPHQQPPQQTGGMVQ